MAGAGAEVRPEVAAASEDLRGASRNATIYRSGVFDGLAGTNLGKLRQAERKIREARDEKITQLFLTNLELVSLPDSLENLTTLEAIYCSENQLTTLPDSIGNMTALKTLWCRNGQLTALPDTLGNCTKLVTLRCENNQLTDLPETLGNCTEMWNFYCSDNPWDEAWLSLQGLGLGDNPSPDTLKALAEKLAQRRVKAAPVNSDQSDRD